MKIGLISGSPKKKDSASGLLLKVLKSLLVQKNKTCQFEALNLNEKGMTQDQLTQMENWDRIVFSFPLYVDGIPAHLLTCLQEMEAYFSSLKIPKETMVYVMVNCGFFEGSQNRLAIDMVSHWCRRTGFIMGQGLGVGGGGMVPSLEVAPLGKGPNKNLGRALEEFSDAVINKRSGPPILINPNFPRVAYMLAAQHNWRSQAKKSGLKRRDLSRRPTSV